MSPIEVLDLVRESLYVLLKISVPIMLVALIAASRMVLSVHFASDILAGLLVGGFWLLAGFTLTEWLRHHRRAAG